MATFRRFVPHRIIFTSPKVCYSTYVQGQSPQPNIREYFYYIDHQGMVLHHFETSLSRKLSHDATSNFSYLTILIAVIFG